MDQQSSEPTRVIIADDNPDVLDAVAQYLQCDYAIIGRVSDGIALVESTLNLRPELLVTDIAMPRLNGLEGLRQLRGLGVQTPAVMLTLFEDEDLINEALSLGALGFVLKSQMFSDLRLAIR